MRLRYVGSPIRVELLAFVLASCTTAGGPPPVVIPPGGGCDLAAQSWQQTSIGPCAASTWRFTPGSDGAFKATETGCSNATGIARYDGSVVAMTFESSGGAGVYAWPLDSGCLSKPGTVTYTRGTLSGQTLASTLSPAP
jgi:hypothetical protein